MRQSQYFVKTRKEAPKDEASKNAQLLIRAGYVDKLMAGVYTFLPLGLRVIENIKHIIREEMNKAGGQEVSMPSLHPKENWETTGRWDTVTDLFTLQDKSKREYALGPTHEEIVTPLVKQFVASYKDLPLAVYQFQTKFRMELRAKSGILRGREFLMKDLYSFHTNEADLKLYYDIMRDAYLKIFKRCGIGDKTYVTFASGGTFSTFSHEFQTITDAGEDTIRICETCQVAINEDIMLEQKTCPQCGKKDFSKPKTAIEVGNIFELKDKFSKPFGLTYKDEKGKAQPVLMGCYGIGLPRVMGTVVELLGDKDGLVWPLEIAPFKVHLVALAGKDKKVAHAADAFYEELYDNGITVLYDDRDASPGTKFADADLLGMPYRIVVSEKTLGKDQVEIKNRRTGDVENIAMSKAINYLTQL